MKVQVPNKISTVVDLLWDFLSLTVQVPNKISTVVDIRYVILYSCLGTE